MGDMIAKYGKGKVYALMALIVVVIVGAAWFGYRPTGGVDSGAVSRSRVRGTGEETVDPAVLSTGNAAWQGTQYRTAAEATLDLVNQQRSKAGLATLAWDNSLAACAMIRATEMPKSFSHTRPDGSDWYTVGPEVMYSECLACKYTSPSDTVKAWMNSATHKKEILTPGFATGSIGIYDVNGTWYWVLEMGY